MALNLSRNTKVFVSSVNGVSTDSNAARGAIVDLNISGGSGFSANEVLVLTGGTGTGAKVIVKAVDGNGAITEIYLPNNFRGSGFTNTNSLTVASGSSSGSGAGFTVNGVTQTTADGGRAGLGLFKGNEKDANTFKIGVLDGYSFSQASESTDVTISEAGSAPNRGSKRFNDALAPAEWSFQTYARPFNHGAASFRANGTHDFAENILWAALAGQAIPTKEGPSDGSGNTTNSAINFNADDVEVDFLSSDAHELLKLQIFFALENTTYRLNECQVNQLEIDFSIDGIATLSWSGNATTIDQVTAAIEDPSKALVIPASGNNSSSTLATYIEKYSYVDVTGSSDADYLRNKLSTLTLECEEQGGGSGSGGLNEHKVSGSDEFDIAITGGSITITNNVTYLTPETLGVVDQSIGSFTGTRQITGSLTCYLDTKDNGSNALLTELQGATNLVTTEFDMSLFMGGDSTAFNNAARTPVIEFDIPKAHLQIPTIETADVISTTIEFAAIGSNLSTGDEMLIKGHGNTVHSESGYDPSSSAAV